MQLIELCEKGGFRLCKVTSNSPEILSAIPETERAKKGESDNSFIEHSLGVKLKALEDNFIFLTTDLQSRPDPNTSRQCLSLIASVFDPMCFLGPNCIKAKKALQVIIALKYGWDVKVPEDLLQPILQWKKKLHLLENIKIRRCFKPDFGIEPIEIQIHGFPDANFEVYGGPLYWRFEFPNGFYVSFIAGKCLVTPYKPITIPRLQLTAARTIVRLLNKIREETNYKIDKVFLWSDSQTVLRKLANSTTRFRIFDENRINEILASTDLSEWDYIRSELNPGDLTRGIEADDT